MQRMPLSFLTPGTEAVVTDVRAGHGMLNRLSAMGICPKSRITVVCADRGSLIVSVAGSRYALSKGMAMKIHVGISAPGGAA
ncbi:FeoA family protein [Methanoregula formicica]|uniref:Fe2+ transport system protein A n=1 Tax=Methanoregula formicica (strain DSM 22288 / NBRC 105244 / SMSP) TaxID=593750 RepID=L0HJ06_METFS|nr:FeoA family protein [Methanoregula formicica]AGB03756.1 Fe2+ transport system protein A [Methanoregula formicica SMSP]